MIRLQLVPFFAFRVNFPNTLDLAHVRDRHTLNEVEVSQSIETASLALVEHHPVFVDRSVRANQEHNVARVQFFARLAIEVAVDHRCLVGNEALVEHLLVLELFRWVLREQDDLQVQVLELRLEFRELMGRLLLQEFSQ